MTSPVWSASPSQSPRGSGAAARYSLQILSPPSSPLGFLDSPLEPNHDAAAQAAPDNAVAFPPSPAPSHKRSRAAAARSEQYLTAYPTLRKLWERNQESCSEADTAALQDYVERLKLLILRAIMDKLGEHHTDATRPICCSSILATWHAKRPLPAPQEHSTPKKHKRSGSHVIPAPVTSEHRAVPGNALVLVPPSSHAVARRLSLFAPIPRPAVPTSLIVAPTTSIRDLLGENAAKVMSVSGQDRILEDVVRGLVRLDAHPEPNRLEFPVLELAAAQQLRIALENPQLPNDLPSQLKVPAQALVFICVAVVEQDHQRNFPAALLTLQMAHSMMTQLEQQNADALSPPLCQALFGQLEARLGSAYRVNRQFDQALAICQAAYDRVRQFQGSKMFRSLRASVSCLLCSAHRWSRGGGSLEKAEVLASESLALYEGLDEPGALLWAASELIKVHYARDKASEVEQLRKRLCTPQQDDLEECCLMRGYRLSYESIKECISLARHAAETPKLLVDATRFLTLAIASAESAPHNGPRCRCASQAEALRRCQVWLVDQAAAVSVRATHG